LAWWQSGPPGRIFFGGGGPSRRSYEIQNPRRLKKPEIMGQALTPGFKEDVFPFARLAACRNRLSPESLHKAKQDETRSIHLLKNLQ
jgi:hypothetical protein